MSVQRVIGIPVSVSPSGVLETAFHEFSNHLGSIARDEYMNNVYLHTKRKIGDLVLPVVLEEEHDDSNKITDHPVLQGGIISDHVIDEPAKLKISGAISDCVAFNFLTDVSKKYFYSNTTLAKGANTPSRILYDMLLEMKKSRVLVDVMTTKRDYKNMVIERLNVSTTPETCHTLMFHVELREINVAVLKTTKIPKERQKEAKKTASAVQKGDLRAKPIQNKPQSIINYIMG